MLTVLSISGPTCHIHITSLSPWFVARCSSLFLFISLKYIYSWLIACYCTCSNSREEPSWEFGRTTVWKVLPVPDCWSVDGDRVSWELRSACGCGCCCALGYVVLARDLACMRRVTRWRTWPGQAHRWPLCHSVCWDFGGKRFITVEFGGNAWAQSKKKEGLINFVTVKYTANWHRASHSPRPMDTPHLRTASI